jgi:glycosyltransferase involved in cell wall biosynthesis
VRAEANPIELSVVMPCLNEADTLAICIEKAKKALREDAIVGEIIVADNGSTDESVQIAKRMGARVVHVREKGYGNALMGGIASARGKFILMGDADDSYDFQEIPRFVEKLRAGADLVQGCRLPQGGGQVKDGAMPFSHRWIGNPVLTILVRRMFRAPVNDVYCGLRGFTKRFYERLDQRCTGMEFATEMLIKASLFGAFMVEVPITLWPDGRKRHQSHLRTFRDGWRTLRFYLTYSPRWLFLYPGALLVLFGCLGYAVAMPGLTIQGLTFDAHTLLFASLAILLGHQAVFFALLTKSFAVGEGLLPRDRRVVRFFEIFSLERGLLLGAILLLGGIGLLGVSVNQWRLAEFGKLDYARTMRWVIPGMTLTVLGFQTVLNSFFGSILGMRRK